MMTPNDAEKIMHIWGRWEEFAFGKLHHIFGFAIPESFLPFPKDTLYKALDIMARQFDKTGNKRGVELMSKSAFTVDSFFVDDEEALLKAAKNFNNPEWRKELIPAFKKFQEDWIK